MDGKFRLTSMIPLAAMAALAGGTYWLLQATLPPPGETVVRPKSHTPDYFADNFSVTELDQTGSTQYRLTAAGLVPLRRRRDERPHAAGTARVPARQADRDRHRQARRRQRRRVDRRFV
ncbi:LPS export ABC transporter periplasmic protein LptC [Burkholderia pseudomallei MSHR684]|nr:LPS export ABC transporter periplasmic protein LptC [Burkholderia pseudomallei MSHR684]